VDVEGTGHTCFNLLIAAFLRRGWKGPASRLDSKLQEILTGYLPNERQECSYRPGEELDKCLSTQTAVVWDLKPYSLAAGYHLHSVTSHMDALFIDHGRETLKSSFSSCIFSLII
jgi:hypothetical protein